MIGMARLDDVVSPIVYPEGVSDEAVEKAVKLSKNLLDHIELHYGIFASQDLPVKTKEKVIKDSQMTALDLIHYHVYGDYRLCMAPTESDAAPEYLKTRFPTTQLRYKAITPDSASTTSVRGDMDLNFLSYQMNNEQFEMLHGVLGTNTITPAETEWFVRELAFGNSAPKFHLPSLGTMAITNYAYKNINDVLGKALAESVELMMETIMFNRGRLPKALSDTFDANKLYGYSDANDELNGNPLISRIAEAIIMNQEYLELQAQYPQVPTPTKINGLAKSAYKKDDSYEAALLFCKQLLSMSNMKYTVGVPVSFKSGAATIKSEAPNYPDVIEGILGSAAEAEPILASETFYVVDARAGPVYDIIMETDSGEEFQINSVPEKELDISVATLEDEALLDRARGKKGGKFTHPSLLVFQRIALDVIFSIEALIAVCTVPHKFYYISPKINTVAKQKSVANYYPKMENHICQKLPMGPPPNAKQHFDDYDIKNAKPTLEFLSSIRLQHTLANIANSEKLILDSRTMEEFYRQDLRMAETMWLASALTDAGKVVFEKKELPNLLAQMQYRAKGIDDSLYGEASVKPESVFYQIDSPILKDVIMQFDAVFVDFTVKNAFAPKGKKKKKGGGGGGGGGGKQKQSGPAQQISALAAAVWGSIERRASEIVNRPGIKPHTLFNRLFSKLDRLNITNIYIRDNYPPKWVGTNTVTLLRSPPEVLGEKLDMKFYTDCMDELIRHLKLLYKAQPEIPIVILQTITEVVVDAEIDVDTLRESFIARIKSQASKPFLKGTSTMFDPFRYVIMIMRTEIDVPLSFREEYVARKLDEEQKKSIKNTFSSMGEKVILPEDHPEFKEKEVKVDEESALYGLPNPYSMPLPAYYPKPGERLNTANPKVRKIITDMVGDPTNPNWPIGFQFDYIGGAITAAQSRAIKARLLNPNTKFTVLPIEWKGSEEIWDGRERKDDRAHPSVVAHFRKTLGIRIEISTPGYAHNEETEIVPSDRLTNYSSILYRKYLNNKYDKPNYVYIPAGEGVFKNPRSKIGEFTVESESGYLPTMTGGTGDALDALFGETPDVADLDAPKADYSDSTIIELKDDKGKPLDEFDSLNKSGTLILKGGVDRFIEEIPEEEEEEIPEEEEEEDDEDEEEPERFPNLNDYLPGGVNFDPVYGSDIDRFVQDGIKHESMDGREQIPAVQRWQITENLDRIAGTLENELDLETTKGLSSSIDSAATKFESAAKSFEAASENFGLASEYFREASKEFAKLPEAIKNGLEQMGARLEDKINEINPKILEGDLEEVSEEELEEYIEVAEADLSETDVPFITEYAELTFSRLSSLECLKPSRYNYKKFESLKPLVDNDLNADFDIVTATVKTKKQVLNWIRNSFVTTLTYYASDEALDETMLNKKDREEYNWRQYIKGVMEVAKDDNDFLPMLGISPAD